MRFAAAMVGMACIASCCAAPAAAETGRLRWPIDPRPVVTRTFDAPSPNWRRGHRGIDLAAAPDQPVHAAGPGVVVFAGQLAGRPVVSIAHPGGLRTTYEPVRTDVRVGHTVATGQVIGQLTAGHAGCPVAACLHWGAMWGPAARADYVDPLGLLTETEIRLKPLGG
jgi:murein DD-endopeptidase MepM/ murein hydrolase activator NlpD